MIGTNQDPTTDSKVEAPAKPKVKIRVTDWDGDVQQTEFITGMGVTAINSKISGMNANPPKDEKGKAQRWEVGQWRVDGAGIITVEMSRTIRSFRDRMVDADQAEGYDD